MLLQNVYACISIVKATIHVDRLKKCKIVKLDLVNIKKNVYKFFVNKNNEK